MRIKGNLKYHPIIMIGKDLIELDFDDYYSNEELIEMLEGAPNTMMKFLEFANSKNLKHCTGARKISIGKPTLTLI